VNLLSHITLGENFMMEKPHLKFLLDFSGNCAHLIPISLKEPLCIQNPTSPQEAHFQDLPAVYFLNIFSRL
jgi:hypothetical protein